MSMKAILVIVIIGVVFIAGCTQTDYSCDEQITELQQEIVDIEEFNKYYTKAITNYNYAVFDWSDAEYGFDLWSWYFDEGYYADSIEYCEYARALYTSSNSYYQSAIVHFEEANKTAKAKYQELIEYYIKASDVAIEINWAMYEACEYYESACNYYDRYYDNYDDVLWETGNSELEIGNERIVLHDSLVTTYNAHIAKIEMLEENL